MSKTPAFLVAGTHSGVGKTTVSFTLMALLAQKGFAVQPFKIGPDFIDGGYHRLATGEDSINLDLWMMDWPGIQESFQRYSLSADVSMIEGMGALFDGKNGTTSGSSADIAKRLKIPVVLVVDIWGMTVTTGALLEGILSFDRGVRLAGVVLNRAGSQGHFEMVMKSLKPALRQKVIGYLLRSPEFEIPERHLGLKTLEENKKASQVLKAAVGSATKTIDIQKLIKTFRIRKTRRSFLFTASPQTKVRIGVAKDPAFCFYYAENLRMLEGAGAKLIPFSPMKDKHPPKVDGLYIGGGYPESFPKELSANQSLRREILKKVKEGLPVYAECGGLMYLSESLTDFYGKAYPMVSAVPLKIKMERNRLTIRYVEAKTTQDTLLGPKGTLVRGHEFHHSRISSNRYRGSWAYQAITSTQKKFEEGFQVSNLFASYIHLHFRSNPSVPQAFVEKCREQKFHHGDP
jgi:cobyrinic acid a,c-diamide synthase